MRRVTPLLISLLLLAACSTGGSPASNAPGSSAPPAGEPVLTIADGEDAGPGMSVAEALGHRATDDLVAVSGALFVDPDGTVRLCDAIAESFPPQCGGERIVVEGLNLAAIGDLQTEGEVSWAESVTLFGSVD
jgi:hypothetical protein